MEGTAQPHDRVCEQKRLLSVTLSKPLVRSARRSRRIKALLSFIHSHDAVKNKGKHCCFTREAESAVMVQEEY